MIINIAGYVREVYTAEEYRKLQAENARLREALVLIDCNDVNPSTSDISPLKRQQVMGRIARVALREVKDA